MASPNKAPAGPTLLLADDSVTIQKVIELTFADQGVRVVAVGDGDAAIALVEKAPPDIVLADVGMPGKSGYEVARYIKQSSRLSHIPVLLLTGAFEPLDQSRAREAGCDGVLAKPFEPQLVISRVRELLDRSGAARPEPAAPAAADSSAPTVAEGASMPGEPESAGPAETMASTSAAVAPVLAQTPPAATKGGGLADAFAALLAAEQRTAGGAAAPAWAPPAPAATDELIDEVAERVLDRLSNQVVRQAVADAVSGIAERLVREEIERIKASVK